VVASWTNDAEETPSAQYRSSHGLAKLHSIDIDACHVMRDGRMINALLDLADEVYGFIGWTVDPDTYWAGIQYRFIHKVNVKNWNKTSGRLPRYLDHGASEGRP
jgi:hypothetical protein